jgi:Transcriptional regulator
VIDVNERNLLCFIKVYLLGNIHRAAEELYLSPQAVSKVINRLEKELGEELFVRTSDGVYPTPFADKLKERADIILHQYAKIRDDFLDSSEHKIFVLRIASTYAVLKYLTLDFLKGFYDKYPNIRLNFVEYPEYPIYEMLKKGQLDLAFLPDPIDVNLFEFIFCFSHKYCAVMNKNHPLAEKKVLEYKDLNHIPLALKGREYAFFPANVSRFAKGGLTPEIQIETSDDSLIVEAAKSDWCVGITADYLAREYADEHTAIRPFSDETFVRNIFLAWRKEHKLTRSAECFVQYVKEWVENGVNKK